MAQAVRPMRREDLGAVAKLGAALVRLHHAWDAQRFFVTDDPVGGYLWFLGTQLDRDEVVLLVAEVDGELAGYFYGALAERSWELLLDAHGAVHDVYVAERFRRRGLARALMEEGVRRLEEKGAPRVVLMTSTRNAEGQALFQALGFRPTMIELTREAKGR